jgi:SAM-dependent methyltransferase
MSLRRKVFRFLGRVIGRVTRRYYFEDFERVYPNGLRFDRFGRRLEMTSTAEKNYENHRKFYRFAGQFVAGKKVLDVGCGSGYGCEILKGAGASEVHGLDASRHAIRFARSRFGRWADFRRQTATRMSAYPDGSFDIVVSAELIEHLRKYRVEAKAINEMARVLRPGGLLVLSAPNSELLPRHGIPFEGIRALVSDRFDDILIFENALIPLGARKSLWTDRIARGAVGVTISERIDLAETVFDHKAGTPELKRGVEAGTYRFGSLSVDTTLLHNTHSWVVLAFKERIPGTTG